MSNAPALNLDIMAYLMGFICGNKFTVSSIMKTCRAYHPLGVRALLQSSVRIHRANLLGSFHDFMLATPPAGYTTRFQLLRHFKFLDGWSPHSSDYPLVSTTLSNILSRAIWLNRLSLSISGDEMLEDTPDFSRRLATSLSSMTSTSTPLIR